MINFSDKENIHKLANIEMNSLKATLNIQKNLNKQIFIFMKSFIGKIEVSSDFNPTHKAFSYINDSIKALNKSNANIESIKELLTHLEKLTTNKMDMFTLDFQNELTKYNENFKNTINTVYKNTEFIEKFIHEISLINIPELLNEFNNSNETSNDISSDNSPILSQDLNTSFIEDTLIISEFSKKVILPYKMDTVKEILLNNSQEYKSIEDVINKLYTKPISYYKVSCTARFKEAYKLIIEKEKGSKLKALSLASELFFNYNLHPAIITACSSLDELDIYLACLDDGSLEDFTFFDIKYEIPPAIIKNETI